MPAISLLLIQTVLISYQHVTHCTVVLCLPHKLISVTIAVLTVVDCSFVDGVSNDEASQTNWDWKRDIMLMQEYLGLSTG